MEIRKITPEEDIYSERVSSVAYFWKLDKVRERGARLTDVWGGFDKNGGLCSRMILEDYPVRFDGHTVKMCGIGGVATLPDHRNERLVRGMFEKALPDMKERGYLLTFLFPFSFVFYRKFGYELCYAHNRVTIPAGALKTFKTSGGFEMYQPGGDFTPFMSIYEKFVEGKNLSVVRDAAAWESILNHDPYATNRVAYINARNGGGAYILFDAEGYRFGEPNSLRVTEIAWTDAVYMYDLFGFLNVFGSQFEKIIWKAPDGFNAQAYFPENGDVAVTRDASAMGRVTDVPRALESLKTPERAGRAIIQISDEIIASNSGSYELEWGGGASSVKKTGREADLVTDIRAFSQLATGFLSFEQAKLLPNVKITGNAESLRALFPGKELYMRESF